MLLKAKPVLIVTAVLIHFVVLIVGMAENIFNFTLPLNVARAKLVYTRITGAGAGFGFFSPNIANEIDLIFDLTKEDGSAIQVTLQDLANSEVNARVGNMIRMLAKNYEKEQVLRSLAASFAAYIFKHYPESRIVKLTASVYRFPSYEDFKKGQRPEFKQVYTATFEVDGK